MFFFPLLSLFKIPEPKHPECALCWPLLGCEGNELALLTCSLGDRQILRTVQVSIICKLKQMLWEHRVEIQPFPDLLSYCRSVLRKFAFLKH